MEENTNQNIDQQLDNTQPADNGDQSGGKMFTQEEVNEIVRTRLERERKKHEPKEPTEAEIREKELTARENRLTCREYLSKYQYPAELLDILDTSDVNEFKNKADAVAMMMENQRRANDLLVEEPMRSTEPIKLNTLTGFEKQKHTPKRYPPIYEEY